MVFVNFSNFSKLNFTETRYFQYKFIVYPTIVNICVSVRDFQTKTEQRPGMILCMQSYWAERLKCAIAFEYKVNELKANVSWHFQIMSLIWNAQRQYLQFYEN